MHRKIKFAHLADLHLGGWREKQLTKLNFFTFQKAIEKILEEMPEFVLFAGDIFNNAIPPLDLVEKVVKEFMKLKEKDIRIYVIGGSHDYSNTGKSFINLLESAGVFVDVSKVERVDKNKVNLKFFKDKSGAVISGILGKKNGLDKNYYANLNNQNLDKNNFNIFMFHTTLNDIKPEFMKAVKSEVTSTLLPKGFDYYAGGHVHTHILSKYDGGVLSYPGPLFPNNFSEFKREKPSFNLCQFDLDNRELKINRTFLETYEKEHIKVEIKNLNSLEAKSKIEDSLVEVDFKGKILLLEISGIVEGKVTDIELNKIVANCYNRGAIQVLKNTYKLTSSIIQSIAISNVEDVSKIEEETIERELENDEDKKNSFEKIKKLLSLELSKQEGEKVVQYEQRVIEAIDKSLK